MDDNVEVNSDDAYGSVVLTTFFWGIVFVVLIIYLFFYVLHKIIANIILLGRKIKNKIKFS